MLIGRFAPILAALALAGALVAKPVAPVRRRHAAHHTPTFVVTLIFVIILVAALNFLPALAARPGRQSSSRGAPSDGHGPPPPGARGRDGPSSPSPLGLVYPLAMTGVAQALFPVEADGSLVKLDGKVVGRARAARSSPAPAYFHTAPVGDRPADNPSATTFANLGRTRSTCEETVNGYVADALALERPYDPGLQARDCPWT